ncbi:hypothetical protein KEM55_001382, partial [Ascosphaera atra]
MDIGAFRKPTARAPTRDTVEKGGREDSGAESFGSEEVTETTAYADHPHHAETHQHFEQFTSTDKHVELHVSARSSGGREAGERSASPPRAHQENPSPPQEHQDSSNESEGEQNVELHQSSIQVATAEQEPATHGESHALHYEEPPSLSIVPQYVYGEQHMRIPRQTRTQVVTQRLKSASAGDGDATVPRRSRPKALAFQPVQEESAQRR